MNCIQVLRALSLIETGSSRRPTPSKRDSAKENDFSQAARLVCWLSLKFETFLRVAVNIPPSHDPGR